MSAITGGLSRTELEDLRHMFELFDTESKGTLSLLELKTTLQQVATEGKRRPTLDKVLASPAFQTDQDRRIDQDEFIQLMTTGDDNVEHGENEGMASIGRVFELFDTEKKGYISIEDLQRISEELGESSMGDEELGEMIQRAAATEEGKVTLDDFAAVLNQNLFAWLILLFVWGRAFLHFAKQYSVHSGETIKLFKISATIEATMDTGTLSMVARSLVFHSRKQQAQTFQWV